MEHDPDSKVEAGAGFLIALFPEMQLAHLNEREGVARITHLTFFDATNRADGGDNPTLAIISSLQVALLRQNKSTQGFLIPFWPAITVQRISEDFQAGRVFEVFTRQNGATPHDMLATVGFDICRNLGGEQVSVDAMGIKFW